ncbi:hypothetical protein GCM10008904_24450 [Paraclostridium ghonii]|uniref:Uncharacterized protein n=1 Tax=Paraclostridium ghonii TaxID=29358 RepID=A0ABU0MZ58_9FIRM|nr:hypothetical protein [Paeniclostridium ghonii]MDQ0556203.1 hypothetical protein [Paeniclostridium ghonii]
MDDFLVNLNSDIKRCEEVLKLNNYLEIVIAIEELTDKYKDDIDGLESSNDRVWNFSKKDLEFLMDKLLSKRNEILKTYINSNVNIEKLIGNLKVRIKNDNSLSEITKLEVIENIDCIEEIYNGNLDKDLTWQKIKKYAKWTLKQDVNIGTSILNLINTIINNKKDS